MIASRGLIVAQLARQAAALGRRSISTTSVQKSSHIWSYRTAAPPAPKWAQIGAELAGGLMWWWILWHLFHEHEHVTGEFPYPDPSEWTDKELGIPHDSEGLAPKLE